MKRLFKLIRVLCMNNLLQHRLNLCHLVIASKADWIPAKMGSGISSDALGDMIWTRGWPLIRLPLGAEAKDGCFNCYFSLKEKKIQVRLISFP